MRQERIDVIDRRVAYQPRKDDDVLSNSGLLTSQIFNWHNAEDELTILMIDGKLDRVLRKGHHLLWRGFTDIFYRSAKFSGVIFEDERTLVASRDAGLFAEGRELAKDGELLEISDEQRLLIWVDGRFRSIHSQGIYALWNKRLKISHEVVEITSERFNHIKLARMLEWSGISSFFDVYNVGEGEAGVVFFEGKYQETLEPGRYVYWKGLGPREMRKVSLKEQTIDIAGQDIMTSDKVSLRMNTVLTVAINDPLKSLRTSADAQQSLYREAQLALRAAVGTRELDALLSEKQELADELVKDLRGIASTFGYELKSFGIRDIVLPGEMKDLLNKVTEAKKASEAALITRREETAAARMQANTAKILASNPELIRLRELEALQNNAEKTQLTVIMGEGGLVEKVSKLL